MHVGTAQATITITITIIVAFSIPSLAKPDNRIGSFAGCIVGGGLLFSFNPSYLPRAGFGSTYSPPAAVVIVCFHEIPPRFIGPFFCSVVWKCYLYLALLASCLAL